MALRGIRGATTVVINSKEEIVNATKELLSKMLEGNKFQTEEIASILFSVTNGLNAEFPAVAARELGWNEVPLLCVQEIDVPGSLTNCIRILLHVNTDKKQKDIKHVYLREAVNLRR
jgi:chorismate mutase